MRTTVIGLQFLLAAVIGMSAPGQAAPAAAGAPIRIGITTPMQLAVGRDSQDGAQLAIDEINAKGGVFGRRLEMVVADETENPETGITAVKKLTSDEKVDVPDGELVERRHPGATAPHLDGEDHLPGHRRCLARHHRQSEDR